MYTERKRWLFCQRILRGSFASREVFYAGITCGPRNLHVAERVGVNVSGTCRLSVTVCFVSFLVLPAEAVSFLILWVHVPFTESRIPKPFTYMYLLFLPFAS